jgi:glycosyltransferase involved in cell wall biosynthesis
MVESSMLSALIPVTDRYDDPTDVYYAYKHGLEATGLEYEMVYILDGPFPDVLNVLQKLIKTGEKIKIVTLAKRFGEATALTVGFRHSSGSIIVALPAYQQVEAYELPNLVTALRDNDMVLARRWPRQDSFFNRLQARIFNRLLRFNSDLPMHDAGCNVRVYRRQVAEEVQLYADLHTFLPIMAHQHGFKIVELNVTQSERDKFRRVYSGSHYVHKLLDVLTIFFLVKFTKKPLRFFGLIGGAVLVVGAIATLYVVAERIFLGVDLANRPALLLSSLMIVLGIQIFAIGLIGEIIIFTHAREIKDYTVGQVING